MATYRYAQVPAHGHPIEYADGALSVPVTPIIPFIEGDDAGAGVWRASARVFDAAVERAFGGARKIAWMEILAGEKAKQHAGEFLPAETLEACREFRVAIAGPLTTPAADGARSLRLALRQELGLYAGVRHIRYFKGVGAPVREPERVNVVIFRENAEAEYADTELGARRVVEMAILYALKHGRESVTLVHKGNIQKTTDGSFRDWGYEVAREKFATLTVTAADMAAAGIHAKADALIVNDRIADAMFQQMLLRPSEYGVLATSNLDGDYLADAIAAQVGGLGMAPGANIGDGFALFDASRATSPKHAGPDKANPCAVILSGVMMFEYLGWQKAADLMTRGVEHAIAEKRVTPDLARHMPGSTEVSTSEFGDAIIAGMAR